MGKGRVFNKLKEDDTKSNQKLPAKTEDQPLAQYKETLYTGTPDPKKGAHAISGQSTWRNVPAIEKNVDIIHIKSANKPANDIDRIVDSIIARKKK